jgi:prepilin-type processing-associated H-X9-DG protein
MRTIETEVPADDPFFQRNNQLNRAKANWKRVAARHNGGGNYLFSDGHGDRIDFEIATTNKQGTRNPSQAGGDWNTDTLIWNPLGPARD